MSDTSVNTSGCSYTDGAQYVGCQVAEKGWPMPSQSGGKRSKTKKCSKCGKGRSSKCSCMTKVTRNRRRTRNNVTTLRVCKRNICMNRKHKNNA